MAPSGTPPLQEPANQRGRSDQQHNIEVLTEEVAGKLDHIRPKCEGQGGEDQKANQWPEKMANRKRANPISETAAAKTNNLKGVGGGSIAGNIRLQKGCLSKAA